MAERFGWRVKTAATTRTSLATATADPDLTFPIVAGKTYVVRFGMMIGAGAACDFKYSFRCLNANIIRGGAHVGTESPMVTPAAGWSYTDNESGTFGLTQLQSGTVTKTVEGAGDESTYVNYRSYLQGMVTFTATENGTFEFLWSQATAHATQPAEVRQGSFLFYEVLDDAPYQWAQKQLDESRYSVAGTVPWGDDADLQITLEPDTRYIIEVLLIAYCSYTYGGRFWCKLTFDGDIEENVGGMVRAPVWYTSAYDWNNDYSSFQTTPDDFLVSTHLFNATGSNNTAQRGSIWRRAFVKTGASGGTVKLQWAPYGVINGRVATLFAGSMMYAAKLNQCTFGIAS